MIPVKKKLLKRIRALEEVLVQPEDKAERVWHFMVKIWASVPSSEEFDPDHAEEEYCKFYGSNKKDQVEAIRKTIQLHKMRMQTL